MTTRIRSVRSLPVILATLGAMALTGCGDRPITDLSEELDGRPVLKTIVAPGEVIRPGGSLEIGEAQVADFDPTAQDAFGRADEAYSYFAGSACPCYFITNEAVLGTDTDPRSPALLGASFGSLDLGSGAAFYVLGPEYWEGDCPDCFDWWGGYSGVPASTRLWVGLVRYNVSVAGDLDQESILSTGSVGTPDALVIEDENPGGDGTRRADLFNTADPYPAEPDANPYVFGYADSDADGNVAFDVVTSALDASGDRVYYPADDFDASESPIGINENGSFAANQYNYIVVWMDDPLTTADPREVLRMQVGADLQAGSLDVENNAFAPYPDAKLSVSLADSLALPGTLVGPSSLSLTLTGMPAVAMDVQAFSRESGSFSGPLSLTVTDSEGNTTEGSTFTGPGDESVLTVEASGSESTNLLDFSHVVVTLSGGEDDEFLFSQYFDESQAFTAGDFTFGGFDSPDDNFEYSVAGSGVGEFFGDSLIVRLRRVPTRTPEGFHYQTYMVRLDEGAVGAQQRLHGVELNNLGNGSDRIAESEVGSFADWNFWTMVLEPNTASVMTRMNIQQTEDYKAEFADFFSR